MPTASSEDEEVDKIYDEINTIIQKTPKRDLLILTGDFNSKIGGLGKSYPDSIGKSTGESTNERGARLKFHLEGNHQIFKRFYKNDLL